MADITATDPEHAAAATDANATAATDPAAFERAIDELAAQVPVDRTPAGLERARVDESGWAGPDRKPPLAVALPENVAQVQAVMRWATRHRIPVIPRGAASGVAAAGIATAGQLSLDLERMNHILDINVENSTITVEPGVITKDVDEAAREVGLHYAPDPASYATSTIGGNIATNAGGLACIKYGVTSGSVLALDCVLANGELIHIGHDSIKGVAGYDLVRLIVGSEGTLAVVVGATLRLRGLPRHSATLAAYFDSIADASHGVTAILGTGITPSQLELIDHATLAQVDAVAGTDYASRGNAFLLAQSDALGAAEEIAVMADAIRGIAAIVETTDDPDEAARITAARRLGYTSIQQLGRVVPEDVAVPRGELTAIIDDINAVSERNGVKVFIMGHAGDGNLHPLILAEGASPEAVDRTVDEIMRLAIAHHGTISGEHGVGRAKLPWLELEQEPLVRELQRGIKRVFDPLGILNPGAAI
ncbi:FAD-binding protein [Bifidobacterium sp. DSM 109958]|uniref:FAD-binding protein n=1 Tax=Bifidobacterium moraviense TaxID=2675323 RepID=A0A7Y0F239_9BIFI|nr:FAD-linked oxidase C-terminal domain-containing protein [Bifidobacterium sp. DSM 109958]NMN00644.1 FAD-binding protein [Bifidobacterium sp. DSM 109958]